MEWWRRGTEQRKEQEVSGCDFANRVASGQMALCKDLKETREPARWVPGGRAFQAEGSANAKVLRQVCVWSAWGPSSVAGGRI